MPTEPETKPTENTEKLVTVALRKDAIAHLKWLNEEYNIDPSLEGALDKIIALTANAYRQKDKLGLVIKTPKFSSQNQKEEELVVVALPEEIIAHLKWINREYINLSSLDDTLDLIIELAAFIYEKKQAGVISIKQGNSIVNWLKNVLDNLNFTNRNKKSSAPA